MRIRNTADRPFFVLAMIVLAGVLLCVLTIRTAAAPDQPQARLAADEASAAAAVTSSETPACTTLEEAGYTKSEMSDPDRRAFRQQPRNTAGAGLPALDRSQQSFASPHVPNRDAPNRADVVRCFCKPLSFHSRWVMA